MGYLKRQTEIIIIINKYKKNFLYIITGMLTSRFLQKSRCFSTESTDTPIICTPRALYLAISLSNP